MKRLCLILILLSATQGFALLSPLDQSIKEIEAIFNSSELSTLMGTGSPIMQVLHLRDGYLISNQEVKMIVEVQYLAPKRLGPAQFTLHFNQPTPVID